MRYLRWFLLTILIGLAIAKLYPHFHDFSQVWDLKNNINYYFLAIGIFAQSGQYIGDGWLSQTILKIIGVEMKFKNAVKIASLNVLAAHLFPVGEIGSIGAAYYFYKKLGTSTQSFIFLSVCWSAITALTLFAIFLTSMFFIPHLPYFNFKLIATVIIAVLAALIAAVFIFHKFIWHKIRERSTKYEIVRELIEFKHNATFYKKALLSHKLLLFEAFLACLVYYGTNILTLSFSFLTFGLSPSIPLVAFAYALSLWSGVITLSPAGLGAAEATMILIFLGYGLDPAKSLAVVLTFRLISFWIPIPAGALSYFSLKKHL